MSASLRCVLCSFVQWVKGRWVQKPRFTLHVSQSKHSFGVGQFLDRPLGSVNFSIDLWSWSIFLTDLKKTFIVCRGEGKGVVKDKKSDRPQSPVTKIVPFLGTFFYHFDWYTFPPFFLITFVDPFFVDPHFFTFLPGTFLIFSPDTFLTFLLGTFFDLLLSTFFDLFTGRIFLPFYQAHFLIMNLSKVRKESKW